MSHAFVVMAYGESPFLADCLRSLADQSVASPITITTSTPSRHIEDVAARFGVPVSVNPRREGIAADWNFALRAAPTPRVTLAHQDDIYYPRFADRSVALLDAVDNAVAAFTGYDEIADDGSPKTSKISRVKHLLDRLTLGTATRIEPGRLRAFLSLGNPLPCSSVTFDRARLGDFRFSADYQSNLDWDAWLRLAGAGHVFARAPERLIGRRHNPLTATSRLIREGIRQREDLALFRRLWPSPMAEAIAWAYRAGY